MGRTEGPGPRTPLTLTLELRSLHARLCGCPRDREHRSNLYWDGNTNFLAHCYNSTMSRCRLCPLPVRRSLSHLTVIHHRGNVRESTIRVAVLGPAKTTPVQQQSYTGLKCALGFPMTDEISFIPSPQLTTFPTFQRRLLAPEGIPNSRASRLSRRQRSHRLTFLSSGGGGLPITAFTADADAGPEYEDDDGILSFRANSSYSLFA